MYSIVYIIVHLLHVKRHFVVFAHLFIHTHTHTHTHWCLSYVLSNFFYSSSKALKKEAAGFSSRGASEDSYNQVLYAAALAAAGSGGMLGPSPGAPPSSPPPGGLVGRPIPRIGTCDTSLTPPSNPASRIGVGMHATNISTSSNHSDVSHTPPPGMGHALGEDSVVAGGGGESMSLQRQLSVLSHSLVNNLPIRAEQLLALRNENEVSLYIHCHLTLCFFLKSSMK